jgi:hypothetical protein
VIQSVTAWLYLEYSSNKIWQVMGPSATSCARAKVTQCSINDIETLSYDIMQHTLAKHYCHHPRQSKGTIAQHYELDLLSLVHARLVLLCENTLLFQFTTTPSSIFSIQLFFYTDHHFVLSLIVCVPIQT